MTASSFIRCNSLLASLLLGFSIVACAQPGASAPGDAGVSGPMHNERMGRHDPAHKRAYMAERIAKRQAELKAKLQITPAQEAAWSGFVGTMQMPTQERPHSSKQDMHQMTTPQRIDHMRAMRAERMAEMNAHMDKRDHAVKSLYEVLSPEQRKVFDAETLPRRGAYPAGPGGMHGMDDGGYNGYHGK